MYDEILLPVDANAATSAVLRHVGELARWSDATVRLLFVADTTRDSVTVAGTDVVDALVREGEETVDRAGGTLGSLGVDYETDVVQGGPPETIVDYADRYDYDLIAMATSGREGISRHLLGSVTERVVRLSAVPVLTARTQDDESLRFPYESVLVPTDGSDGAMRAARHGVVLADALDATLHALSVIDEGSLGPDVRSAISDSAGERAADDAVEAVASAGAERGLAVEGHVERGSPHEEILRSVDDLGIDAVVVGTTGRRGIDRVLLGSVAERVVRSTPVPVITVGGASED